MENIEWRVARGEERRVGSREWRVGSSELGLELMATGKRTFERRCST